MKTLIVEDEPTTRLLLSEILESRGHEVSAFEDAESAWDSYLQEKHSLIILDWMLPGMSGLELCRLIRARPDGDWCVILVVTARDHPDDLKEVLSAGASDYLAKPIDFDLLSVRLTIAEKQVQLITARKLVEEELAKAREHEVEIAGSIQQSILLGSPLNDLSTARAAAISIPSQKIDGDFYDFLKHNEYFFDVVVGDVMGKGIPAALLGAAMKSEFIRSMSTLIISSEKGELPKPADIVTHLHNEMTGQLIELESFVTFCYARFDIKQMKITFVDCGHTKTIHYSRSRGRCDFLQGENVPLGFTDKEVYQQVSAPFGTGDVFCFYSDGVTETRNSDGDFFGEEKLTNLIEQYHNVQPEKLLDLIHKSVVEFSQSEQFGDDLTCVIVRIKDQKEVPPLARSNLDTTTELSELETIRTFVGRFSRINLGELLTKEMISEIELATHEAATNIMKHAYNEQTDRKITLETEAFPDRLVIRMYYHGKNFDPAAVAKPSFDGSREGGFGIFIISHCMDYVQYTTDENGRHCIVMIKNFNAVSSELKHDRMPIDIRKDIVIVTVPGDSLDASNTDEFKRELEPTLSSFKRVVIDMSHVQFIDSSGLSALMSCLRMLNSKGGELKLAGMSAHVRSFFQMVRADRMFDIFNSREDAIRTFELRKSK